MAVFEKGIRLRHIGHLDIQRAMMRALRRSGLPVAYSNGYNPHILLTFASALSTGAAEKGIPDVTMAREVSPDDFLQQMNRALPPDLQLSLLVCWILQAPGDDGARAGGGLHAEHCGCGRSEQDDCGDS